jgi:hypothetical protein
MAGFVLSPISARSLLTAISSPLSFAAVGVLAFALGLIAAFGFGLEVASFLVVLGKASDEREFSVSLLSVLLAGSESDLEDS